MRTTILPLLIVMLGAGLLYGRDARAQKSLNARITISLHHEPVEQALEHITDLTGLRFSYTTNLFLSYPELNGTFVNEKLSNILEKVLAPAGVVFEPLGKQYIILKARPKVSGLEQLTDGELEALSKDIPLAIDTGITVTGKVTDAAGNPLPGVAVHIQGTSKGVSSAVNGQFKIVAPKGEVLVFSLMGYRKMHLTVTDNTPVKMTLQEDVKGLDEVVVVGYGTVKRRDLTGSIASVKGSDLAKVPVQNVAQALAGRAAGVQVSAAEGSPGAGISIKIRGGGSITQSNEPLYVIDGFPQTDGLSFLDPTDIENIEVLKDASATAIYGARGANGVVLVTTKKGVSGRTQVSYDMYYGGKQVTSKIDMMTPYDYVLMDYERSMGDADLLQKFITRYGAFSDLKTRYEGRPGIDWQQQLYGGNATTQYHKIGASGGNKNTRFNLFYSFNNEQGIMVNSGAKKNVAKLSIDHSDNNRLKVSASVTYTTQNIYGSGTSEGENRFNKLMNILQYRPTIGKSGNDIDLVNADEDPALQDDNGNVMQNPRTNAFAEYRSTNLKALYLNGALEYKLLKNLTYKGVVGLKANNRDANLFNGDRSVNARRTGGPNGSIGLTQGSSWNYSNTLTFDKSFHKKHKLNVLIGQEQLYATSRFVEASAAKFPNGDIGLDDLSQGALAGIPRSFRDDEKLISFFGRANYSYKDRYLVTASMRADGSSKFGSGNKFGYFPSVALAWRAIEENFMKQQHLLSDLKFRLTYGQSGNNRINNYLSLSLLGTNYYPLNDRPVIGVGSTTLPNPNLKWETTISQNIGADIGFLDQRIQLTADYYRNNTRDLLLNAQVPYLSGYTSVLKNIGETINQGLELTLNTVNISRKQFEWRTIFNISFNKNKVKALAGPSFFYGESGYGALKEGDYLVQVGSPVGLMYGYKSDGVYQVSDFDYDPATRKYTLKPGIPYNPNDYPKPGYLKLQDVSGPGGKTDGLITSDDRTVIGDATPKHYGGITNTFSYKGFDLSIFINWMYGNKIYNANKLVNSQTYLAYRNAYAYIKDRWSTIDGNGNKITDPAQLAEANKGKTIPSLEGSGRDLKFYDQMVEDGSFLRINNVSLGYNLPKSLLGRVKVNSCRLYFTAYNIHTFTSYSGYDPEVSTRNQSGITPGVDFGAYPRSRSYTVGANVAF
ncbi:SusC/RagA family TonB-linked outer membrane protein [Chitinophaga eiseniae]|nr:TonB-dependent receptor [Chitinophaga eiseniae]